MFRKMIVLLEIYKFYFYHLKLKLRIITTRCFAFVTVVLLLLLLSRFYVFILTWIIGFRHTSNCFYQIFLIFVSVFEINLVPPIRFVSESKNTNVSVGILELYERSVTYSQNIVTV